MERKKFKKILITFLIIFINSCISVVYAQTPYIEDYESFSNEDATMLQKKILIDQKGFLWYSNYNKLIQKFDKDSKEFSLKVSPEEPVNISKINALLEDYAGRIWISTSSDIRLLDPIEEKVRVQYKMDHENGEVYPTDIVQLNKSTIYVGTSANYVLEFNTQTHEVTKLILPNTLQAKDDEPIQLWKTHQNILLLKRGNQLFYKATDKPIEILHTLPDSRYSYTSFYPLENGQFFNENQSGFLRYKSNEFPFYYFPELDIQFVEWPFFKVEALNASSRQKKWVGIQYPNQGYVFSVLGKSRNPELVVRQSLSLSEHLTDVVVDRLGLTWFMGYTHLFKYLIKPNYFESHLRLGPDEVVQSVANVDYHPDYGVMAVTPFNINQSDDQLGFQSKIQDYKINSRKKGSYYTDLAYFQDFLWAVDESNKLYQLHPTTLDVVRVFFLPQNVRFEMLSKQNKSKLFIGTSTNTLFYFDFETSEIKSFERSGEAGYFDQKVISAIETSSNYWFCTINDLVKVDKKTREKSSFQSLFRGHKKPVVKFNTLYENSNDIMMVGTNEGLFWLNHKINKIIKKVRDYEGLSHNEVVGIVADNKDWWVTTKSGMSRISKQYGGIQNFHTQDGIPSEMFFKNTLFKLSDTLIVSGTSEGLISFNPKKIPTSLRKNRIFPVRLEYFDSNNNQLSVQTKGFKYNQTIALSSQYSSLSFYFAMNDMLAPNFNRYYYRMPQISNSWQLMDGNRFDFYGQQYGDYILEIKGVTHSGNHTLNTLRYLISLPRPFYLEWWFLTLSIFLIVALLYGWMRIESGLVKVKKDRDLTIANLELNAYRAQMNPHFIFNTLNGMQTAMILRGEKEFNRYVTSFSKLLRDTIEMSKTDKILLDQEIKYLSNYVELQGLRLERGINFHVDVDPAVDP